MNRTKIKSNKKLKFNYNNDCHLVKCKTIVITKDQKTLCNIPFLELSHACPGMSILMTKREATTIYCSACGRPRCSKCAKLT